MTKYRERGELVEAHQAANGLPGMWDVRFLEGQREGEVITIPTLELERDFEPVRSDLAAPSRIAALEEANERYAVLHAGSQKLINDLKDELRDALAALDSIARSARTDGE